LWLGKTGAAHQRLAESARQEAYVFEQYMNADYREAKTAMLNHIRMLDRLSDESGRPNRNPFAVDAMNWQIRLANLEARNHGSHESEYLREACSRCEDLKWADCSKERLRAEVERLDKLSLAQVSGK
jgi:hypothetical protein